MAVVGQRKTAGEENFSLSSGLVSAASKTGTKRKEGKKKMRGIIGVREEKK